MEYLLIALVAVFGLCAVIAVGMMVPILWPELVPFLGQLIKGYFNAIS